MHGIDHKESLIKAQTLESNLSKGRACKTGSTPGAVTAITSAADIVKGFAIDDGVTGENRAIVLQGGIIAVEAGAAISADTEVMIDSVGRVVAWTAAAGTNLLCVGRVLDAATAAGDYIPMRFLPYTKQG